MWNITGLLKTVRLFQNPVFLIYIIMKIVNPSYLSYIAEESDHSIKDNLKRGIKKYRMNWKRN